jgi:hypothetical protein
MASIAYHLSEEIGVAADLKQIGYLFLLDDPATADCHSLT